MTESSLPVWTGRNDGPCTEHARWHPRIAPVDPSQPGFALLGFATDEGVRRNQGHTGAAAGPSAIRAALGSVAVHHDISLFDGGDIPVVDGDLEAAQQQYGATLTSLLQQGRSEEHTSELQSRGHLVCRLLLEK